MKKVFLISLICLQVLGFAAEGKEVLRKIRSNYSELKSCATDMRFAIYRGYTATVPVESYTGFLCRNENNSYRRIHEAEYLNLTDRGFHLQIDHRDRSMLLTRSINEQLFEADLEKSLKLCGNFLVEKSGEGWRVSLILSKATDMPYNRVDLVVSADYWIESITLFYAAKVNFSDDFNRPEMDWVRMQISYANFNTSWKDVDGKLDPANYLDAASDTLQPAAIYKNYSIVDLRK